MRRAAVGLVVFLLQIPAVTSAQEASTRAPDAAPTGNSTEDLLGTMASIDSLTLEDILNTKTQVTTATEKTVRDSPGVITVITREEIEAFGARDLQEILELVPGFAFGADVQGAVGVGFRGMWGHEGKVLLLVDDHELNETLYLTTQFGQHIPADDIERVEVVRGPGSVIYGGYAELAVVNVVTRSAAGKDFATGKGRYDATRSATYSRRGLGIGFGRVVTEAGGLYVGASVAIGQGRRSIDGYADAAGARYDLKENSGLGTALITGDLKWKGVSVGLMYDGYRVDDRSAFGENLPMAASNGFGAFHGHAKWEIELAQGLKLTPQIKYKRQNPWQVLSEDPAVAGALFYDKTAERLTGGLRLSWDILDGLNLLAGVEGQYDHAFIGVKGPAGEYTGLNWPWNDRDTVEYGNFAGYLQVLWDNWLVNVSAGARVEAHSAYGLSVVPRIGLTKVVGDFHAKALYSRAFKAPGIENIGLNADIKPEEGQIAELEVGYLIAKTVSVTVNGYYMSIDRPIVYGSDPATGEESYYNELKTGSKGLEAEVKVRHKRGFGSVTYSLYSAAGMNSVASYAVPALQAPLLGLPNHKLTLAGSVDLGWGLRAGTTLVVLGPRWAYLSNPEGQEHLPVELPWQANWNLRLSWRPPDYKFVVVGLTAHNLLDTRILYPQPYDGGHPPLPGMAREIGLDLSWEM
jgi:outer membrane receptor protein involved in Fe transport